ncbi:MAG: PadR family transcriptional regulator [Bacillota bacterium]|nr:PadR family transcriptional regulator [Bacillota bacterium]
MNSQMLKGILEGCIIKIVSYEETYGYKVVDVLNKLGFEVNEATVYPILNRLEKRNVLMVNKRPSSLGPMRKYFSLSDSGKDELNKFVEEWDDTKKKVESILRRDIDD